jgi:hypothetical protein
MRGSNAPDLARGGPHCIPPNPSKRSSGNGLLLVVVSHAITAPLSRTQAARYLEGSFSACGVATKINGI